MAKRRTKHSPEVRAEIAERYRSGQRSGELAKAYGTTMSTIRRIAREHGAPVHSSGGRYREFTPEEIADMGQLWESGKSQTAIAQHFGTHQVIVSRVLRAAGYYPHSRKPQGNRHGLWKGGRTISGEGYVLRLVPLDSPFVAMRTRIGYVPEHRLVMAEKLGRPLERWETVHHRNGDRQDNRLENLQLRQGRHGNGVVMRCLDCGSHNVAADPVGEDKPT